MKTNRLLSILAALTITTSAFAQAQITTKKEKVSDFTLKTMKDKKRESKRLYPENHESGAFRE